MKLNINKKTNKITKLPVKLSIALHQPYTETHSLQEILCIFTFSKTSFFMIYKLLYPWVP